MKTVIRLIVIGTILGTSVGASNFEVGISGSERGIDGFSLSIGDYYRIPHQEIVVIGRSIPREEISVVYLLSARSHRSAHYITDLRLRGLSWWDITIRLGLDPYNLYIVDSYRHSGPPYGKAYGYHDGGKKHRLRDDEIIELSNVRFLSKYHRITPDDVIDRRRQGEHYDRIDEHYRVQRVAPQYREEKRVQQREQIKPQYREERNIQHREQRKEEGKDNRGSKGGKEERGNGNKNHGNPNER